MAMLAFVKGNQAQHSNDDKKQLDDETEQRSWRYASSCCL
jgi:hypothetical protein